MAKPKNQGRYDDKKIERKFIGDAINYQKARPNYPEELFVYLLNFWKQTSSENDPTIVDLGYGTGIATRGIYNELGKRAMENLAQEKVESQIQELANTYLDHDGSIEIPYISKVYLAKN